jgi:hypothetical protein
MHFECREIVYSVIKYEKDSFSSLDLQSEVQAWKEELESNSFAKPVYVGSILDDDDGHLNLDTSGEEEPDSNTVYVILYYYYEESSYSISDDVENGDEWVVNFDPILSGLGLECAMESVTCGDTTEFFECDSSLNRGESMIAIYNGSEKIMEGSVAELFSAMD